VKYLVLTLAILTLLIAPLQAAFPSETEVRVALQSVVIAAVTSLAAQKLDLRDDSLTLKTDAAFTNIRVELDAADLGRLRMIILESPPPQAPPMGFLELLLSSVIPIFPDYTKLVEFLAPQALYEGEVIFTGVLQGERKAAPYPFRYQGSVDLEVSGRRFRAPFNLQGEFMFPLEGVQKGKIIPLAVSADSQDFLSTGEALFH